MTYGWAIIVVLIVGFALIYLGVFDLGGGASGVPKGFQFLRPLEYKCVAGSGANDTVSVIVENLAGDRVTGVTIAVGADSASCSPSEVAHTGQTTCSISGVDCGADAAGERYEVDVAFGYTSAQGMTRSSAGSLTGPAE